MSSRLQRWIITLTVVALSSVFIVWQLMNLSQDASLSSWNQGTDGYIQAMREHKETGKPIALFFYTDWCPNCKMLRETVLSTPTVTAALENFIPVRINPENSAVDNELSDSFKVIGYPTVLIQTSMDGEPIPIKRTINTTPEKFRDELMKIKSVKNS